MRARRKELADERTIAERDLDDMIDYTLEQLDKDEANLGDLPVTEEGKGGMTWTILQADARQIPLADKSVQCVVTSPFRLFSEDCKREGLKLELQPLLISTRPVKVG